MRSLLFVPADSERKLAKALSCGADTIILDLEDAVSGETKDEARRRAIDFLEARPANAPRLMVRINGLASGLAEADLDAVIPARPDTIILPKCTSGGDVSILSAMIATREALTGLPDGRVGIVPLATETPGSVFQLSTYRGASARLAGLAWASEDLLTALGGEKTATADGLLTDPFRLARTLCLYGAAHAGVPAIDRVSGNFRDLNAFRTEVESARQDGFAAKLAIHPDQVTIINAVFTPTPEAIERARAIVAAFENSPGKGVVGFEGQMLDLPHLVQARALLARAEAAGVSRKAGATP